MFVLLAFAVAFELPQLGRFPDRTNADQAVQGNLDRNSFHGLVVKPACPPWWNYSIPKPWPCKPFWELPHKESEEQNQESNRFHSLKEAQQVCRCWTENPLQSEPCRRVCSIRIRNEESEEQNRDPFWSEEAARRCRCGALSPKSSRMCYRICAEDARRRRESEQRSQENSGWKAASLEA